MTKRTLLRAGGAAAVLAGVVAITRTPVGEGDRSRLLAPVLARLEDRHGYRFQFHPSPGIETFAVTAVSISAADTVRPSFCGDDTGALHVIGDGSTPRIEAGRCASARTGERRMSSGTARSGSLRMSASS